MPRRPTRRQKAGGRCGGTDIPLPSSASSAVLHPVSSLPRQCRPRKQQKTLWSQSIFECCTQTVEHLPVTLREHNSKDTFKKNLKAYLSSENYVCSNCTLVTFSFFLKKKNHYYYFFFESAMTMLLQPGHTRALQIIIIIIIRLNRLDRQTFLSLNRETSLRLLNNITVLPCLRTVLRKTELSNIAINGPLLFEI